MAERERAAGGLTLPRRWLEAGGALLLAAAGAYFLLAGLRLPPSDEPGVPGPGTAPAILGAVVLIIGLALAVLALIRQGTERIELGGRQHLAAFAGLGAAALAFEAGGFLLVTFLFLAGGFTLIGGTTWSRALPAAALAALTLWLVFAKLLGVGLPYGLIGEILFR